jgi:hypothetical protein
MKGEHIKGGNLPVGGHPSRRGGSPNARGPIPRWPATGRRRVEAGRLLPRGPQRRRNPVHPPLEPLAEATAARASLALTRGATGRRKRRRGARRPGDLGLTRPEACRVRPLEIVQLSWDEGQRHGGNNKGRMPNTKNTTQTTYNVLHVAAEAGRRADGGLVQDKRVGRRSGDLGLTQPNTCRVCRGEGLSLG